jgi:hypothetical protein
MYMHICTYVYAVRFAIFVFLLLPFFLPISLPPSLPRQSTSLFHNLSWAFLFVFDNLVLFSDGKQKGKGKGKTEEEGQEGNVAFFPFSTCKLTVYYPLPLTSPNKK